MSSGIALAGLEVRRLVQDAFDGRAVHALPGDHFLRGLRPRGHLRAQVGQLLQRAGHRRTPTQISGNSFGPVRTNAMRAAVGVKLAPETIHGRARRDLRDAPASRDRAGTGAPTSAATRRRGCRPSATRSGPGSRRTPSSGRVIGAARRGHRPRCGCSCSSRTAAPSPRRRRSSSRPATRAGGCPGRPA